MQPVQQYFGADFEEGSGTKFKIFTAVLEGRTAEVERAVQQGCLHIFLGTVTACNFSTDL